MGGGPYRTHYPAKLQSEEEPVNPLRWIFARHTLLVWKVEVESINGKPSIKVYLTTAGQASPSVFLHVPYSVDALVDLSKLVGEGLVDVTISEGTKT